MDPVRIHGFAPSTYTRTARMAAAEKGVPHVLVPLAFGEPEHFALHPFGKMPVLTHGAVTIFETLAVVAYLDRAFGGLRLIPDDVPRQSRALAAISVAIDYAYRPVVHGESDPEGQIAVRVLDWLDATLASDRYLAGEDFTAAELFFAPMIDFHLTRIGSREPLTRRPGLERWYGAMAERPSFASTVAGAP